MGADGKVLRFLNSKVDALFHDKKNPRKLRWTILYRRKHKKGISQEATIKKRGRRNVKAARRLPVCPTMNSWQRNSNVQRFVLNSVTMQSVLLRRRRRQIPKRSRTRHDERRRGVFGLESDTAKSKTPTPYYTTSLFVPHTVNTLIFS